MALTECKQGHLYDMDQYASCPYCNQSVNQVRFSAGADSGVGKTVGVLGGAPSPASETGATVAPAEYGKARQPEQDTGKTVAVLQKSFSREPIAGWLVCIKGAEKGKDYRVAAKNNSIGRSEKMDICIKGDTAISRENHARIAYDVKHNNFYFIPDASVNGVYINDEPVYVPTQLAKGDIVELGESKFIFVPFCDESFSWKDAPAQGE